MRIAAVQHAVPTQRITNDWIVDAIRRASASHLDTEGLDELEKRLRARFSASGTDVRYTLAPEEHAIDMVLRAGAHALEQAGLEPGDIDFLLYTGVGRGWIEPAAASAVQAELGLRNATSFDILDACASWLRALHVAHSFVRSGTYRRGMIVNCECGHYRAYADWEFRQVEALDHRFAGYTIGEAATATIVTDEMAADDFYFTFKTMGEYFDLCMLPLPSVKDFTRREMNGHVVPGRFFSLSRPLLGRAARALLETFDADPRLRAGHYDICFGHEATAKAEAIVTRTLRSPGVYYSTHRQYGNTVSASVPLGMSLAMHGGRLSRGDRILIAVGSAGVTVGFASFTF